MRPIIIEIGRTCKPKGDIRPCPSNYRTTTQMTQLTTRTESRRILLHALYTLVGIYLLLLLSLFVPGRRPTPYDFMIAILCTVGMGRIVTARWMLASDHA